MIRAIFSKVKKVVSPRASTTFSHFDLKIDYLMAKSLSLFFKFLYAVCSA